MTIEVIVDSTNSNRRQYVTGTTLAVGAHPRMYTCVDIVRLDADANVPRQTKRLMKELFGVMGVQSVGVTDDVLVVDLYYDENADMQIVELIEDNLANEPVPHAQPVETSKLWVPPS
jgi:hypothetical protein